MYIVCKAQIMLQCLVNSQTFVCKIKTCKNFIIDINDDAYVHRNSFVIIYL